MILNQVQPTSISPFYESLLEVAMLGQKSQERLEREKIKHSEDQCSSGNMPSRSNQKSTGHHSKFEKPIRPNYSYGNEGNFCSNEDNRRSTPSRPQVCAPTYRINAQEHSISEGNTSSKQSHDRRRDDERTWKAIESGHSTIVCCDQCNFFLEAPMSTSRIFCQICQRVTFTKREPTKYNLLNKREILSLDSNIAQILQSREFQARERKRGDNTSDDLSNGLTNGMNEDLNNIFKMYERNVAPIDEYDMVNVQ